jgi:hypothetical protein
MRRGDYWMAEKLVICDIAHDVLAPVGLSVDGKMVSGRIQDGAAASSRAEK